MTQVSSPAIPRIPALPRQTDTNAPGRPHYGLGLVAPFCPHLRQGHSASRPTCTLHHFLCCLFPLQPLSANSTFSFIFKLQFRMSTPPRSLLRFVPIRSISFFSLLPLFSQHSITSKIRLHCRQGSWCLLLFIPST